MMKNNYKQTGFSLLEVLIALLVLSIGLLGIAGLQATSKRTNFEAIQRTTAVLLARDIIERMRANAGELEMASYTVTVTPPGSLVAPSPDCTDDTTNICNDHADLAAYDLYQWQQALSGASEIKGTANTGGLVEPYGCIVVVPPAAPSTAYEVKVTIAWRGLIELKSPSTNPCGAALGNNRRLLELDTVIFP